MSRRSRIEELDLHIDLLRQKIKDSSDLKVRQAVYDEPTLMNLYALASKGVIDALGGPLATGKEANIFSARGQGKDLAVKIYRIATSSFKAMQDYLKGDPRFGNVRGTKKAVISAWAKKEFRNLKRAEEAGVRVPHPLAVRENILVMELVGEMPTPALPLKEVHLPVEEARRVYDRLAHYISLLYNRAGLVHADLSEFNILYHHGPVLIDMGQSVTLDHPMAKKFLERDIASVARYFKKAYGFGSEEEIWERLRKLKIDSK
jgi:RIO kinase 1